MPFPYKNVLIIGATSGLGLALAERMIENDIFVIGVGRRKDRLDKLVAKYGSDRAAVSQLDITDLDGIKEWTENTVADHPAIDAVILNSGIQRALDFTKPKAVDLSTIQKEITTNYTSYISIITNFLPHLQAKAPNPAAIVAVSSALALVPVTRCANYCATKSALHSLCWTLRAQLGEDQASHHIRVIEIIPPAVQTELHSQQKDLVELGMANVGISIEEFIEDTWRGLAAGEEEIAVGPVKERFIHVDEPRKEAFRLMLDAARKQEQDYKRRVQTES